MRSSGDHGADSADQVLHGQRGDDRGAGFGGRGELRSAFQPRHRGRLVFAARDRVGLAGAAIVVIAGLSAAVVGVAPDSPHHLAAVGLDLDPVPASSPAPTPSPTPVPPEVPQPAWGPTPELLASALADVQLLTVEELAGQLIVAAVSSTSSSSARRLVSEHHLGGVIVMGPAVADREQVLALTGAVHEAMGERAWPAWVSVDHEGGMVARLDPVLPDMPSFMAAGAHLDKEVVREAYRGLGEDIRELGFTVNYAPVADITIGVQDPIIRARSAGSDPTNVSRTVVATVQGFQDAALAATVKHFPGHGALSVDSHIDLPRYRGDVADLAARDLVPFAAAIDAGVAVVMMGHIRVDAWGPGPASLEPAAYRYLREELGFEGVIVTDALNMGAVTRSHGAAGATVAALRSGADIVLMPADVGRAHAAIVEAVSDGTLDRTQLELSAARMVALLRYLDQVGSGGSDGTDEYAQHLVATGATVVTPLCGRPLVGRSVTITGGTSSDRQALAAALEDLGVGHGGGTTVHLLGGPQTSGKADVVVALDGPWGFQRSSADTYVGVYGKGTEVMEGLAQVLAGESQPRALVPVALEGLPYGACPSPR